MWGLPRPQSTRQCWSSLAKPVTVFVGEVGYTGSAVERRIAYTTERRIVYTTEEKRDRLPGVSQSCKI